MDLQQRFPVAVAWGQAATQGGPNVTPIMRALQEISNKGDLVVAVSSEDKEGD